MMLAWRALPIPSRRQLRGNLTGTWRPSSSRHEVGARPGRRPPRSVEAGSEPAGAVATTGDGEITSLLVLRSWALQISVGVQP